MKKRRSSGGPGLELFEDRLPPGASLGGLLGIALSCACIAALDESSAEAALSSSGELQAVPGVDGGAAIMSSSADPVAAPDLNEMPLLLAMLDVDQGQDLAEVPPPPLGQAEEGGGGTLQPSAPAVAVSTVAPSGGMALWDAALSGQGEDSSADGAPAVPQANTAPAVSGAAPNSSGGGGGNAAPTANGPVVVASAAAEIASTPDATQAPSTNNAVALTMNGNDPNINDPGDIGTGLSAAAGKGKKGLSAAAVPAALSSFLQQSTGTKSNFVTGIHDPGTLGPYATSVVDYNLGYSALHFAGFPGGTSGGVARPDAPIEEQGEITYPTNLSGGPYPVIVILHGRHSYAYNPATNATVSTWPPPAGDLEIPSFQGYEYMTPILASYGFIVDSIGANGTNAADANAADAGGLARAKLVEAHLDLLNTFNTATSATPTASLPFGNQFAGTMNLQDVGLMGHSRGGEGVAEAYDYNLSLGSPYGIKAVFALAPIDFQRLKDLNVPFAVMLPYTDGDVSDLQGMHFFDDQSLLTTGNTSPEYEFLVMGADHDLFNSVWTYGLFPAGAADDWAGEGSSGSGGVAAPSATRGADPYAGVVANPSGVAPFPGALPGATFNYVSAPERLQPPAQQDADTAYESAFFQMYLQGQTQYQPILDGDAPTPASAAVQPAGLQGAIVYATYEPPVNSAVRMDVNQTADLSNLTVNTLGGTVTQSGLLTYTMAGNVNVPGETALILPNESGSKQPDSVASSLAPTAGGLSQLVLDWNSTSAYYENDLPAANQNVSGYGTFQLRAAVNPSDPYNDALSENFSVAMTDGHGKSVEVPVSNYTNWLFFPPGKVSPLPKLISQGIRIPLSAFVGIDLTQVTSVKLNFDKSPSGGLVVTDLAFADASPTGKIPATSTTS